MSVTDVDEDVLRKWLAESCKRQGIPVEITNPVVLTQIATLLGRHSE